MIKDRDMKDFVELVGRKVTGFRWYDNIYTDLGWVDEMHNNIGKEGTILEYDSHDDSFQIEFENGDAYWHPAAEAVKHLVTEYSVAIITESVPVFDVNKTVELAVATSELGDYIIIGQLLLTIPLSLEGNSFTRPFLQDGCYCAYGWTVSESNEAIDLCVAKGLFKLV